MIRRIIVYIAAFVTAYIELVLIESRNPCTSVLLGAFDSLVFGTLANAVIDAAEGIVERAKLENEKKRTLKTIRVHARVIRVYEATEEIRQEKGLSFFRSYVKNISGGGSHTVVVFEDDNGKRYSFADVGIQLLVGDAVLLEVDCYKRNGKLVFGMLDLHIQRR